MSSKKLFFCLVFTLVQSSVQSQNFCEKEINFHMNYYEGIPENTLLDSIEFLNEYLHFEYFRNPVSIDSNNIVTADSSSTYGIRSLNSNLKFTSLDSQTNWARCFSFADTIQSINVSDSNEVIVKEFKWNAYEEYSSGYIENTQCDFIGFYLTSGANVYFGWISVHQIFVNAFGHWFHILCYNINENPNSHIQAGFYETEDIPNNLFVTYVPNGILMNWSTIDNSQACQVQGGPLLGSETHNFILNGFEPSFKFVNGNSLDIGEFYKWRVRCATGINPYSGVSDWSEYGYFIYEP